MLLVGRPELLLGRLKNDSPPGLVAACIVVDRGVMTLRGMDGREREISAGQLNRLRRKLQSLIQQMQVEMDAPDLPFIFPRQLVEFVL